jgi:phage repressor protein C with HTH and peptisase S24 domain
MDALTLHRKARLQALIDARPWGGNQAQFAHAAGVTKARITQLLDPSDSFGERAAKNIADRLNLPDRYFEEGFAAVSSERGPSPAPVPRELPPPSVHGEPLSDFVAVRRADVKFSNGTGHVVYAEDDHPPLVFRSDFLRRMGIAVGNAVVVEADGDSNEPKIPNGAVVLINRGDRERLNGDLFAFRVDGELLIKRLERIEGVGILATAENPNFKPKQKVYLNPPDFEVIGKAVWTGALL